MVCLGARPLQHVAIERRIFVRVEAQRPRAAWEGMRKFGTGPVQHRHEIVADDLHAALGEIPQRSPVGIEQRRDVAVTELDGLRHGQALDHAPAQAERGVACDEALALLDLVDGPFDAVGNLMQSGNDTARAGLANVRKLDHVVRAEPAPSLFHQSFLFDA
jgi:hypothetical protein